MLFRIRPVEAVRIRQLSLHVSQPLVRLSFTKRLHGSSDARPVCGRSHQHRLRVAEVMGGAAKTDGVGQGVRPAKTCVHTMLCLHNSFYKYQSNHCACFVKFLTACYMCCLSIWRRHRRWKRYFVESRKLFALDIMIENASSANCVSVESSPCG